MSAQTVLDQMFDAIFGTPERPTPKRCDLGVGCDEAGVCYAIAHNQPDQCGRAPDERLPAIQPPDALEASEGICALPFLHNNADIEESSWTFADVTKTDQNHERLDHEAANPQTRNTYGRD